MSTYKELFFAELDQYLIMKNNGNPIEDIDAERDVFFGKKGVSQSKWFRIAEWIRDKDSTLSILLPKREYTLLKFNRNQPQELVKDVDIIACGLSVGGQMLVSIVKNGIAPLTGNFVGLDPKIMETSTSNRTNCPYSDPGYRTKTTSRSALINNESPFLNTEFY